MKLNRRSFFKVMGATGAAMAGTAAGTALTVQPKETHGSTGPSISPDAVGCLIDTTLCVGCRKCEQACNKRHHLAKPEESFNEMAVLEKERRPDETSYTIVNKYYPKNIGSLTWRRRPTFVKFQCMHCNDPSCVSACIVGALTKEPNGPVIYNASKCIGCRYCMIACPFQIPAYEYYTALDPEVRKCTFCFEYIKKEGGLPACAQVCPREVITFGKRSDLLELARWKMKNDPGKYVDHIYGEHEVGGTSWLYLASEPFETIGFPELGTKAPPRLTEAIQHGLFQYFAAPIGLYAVLGGIMWATGFYGKKHSFKE
ncbi:MAG: 4Fe-4S dicluster domain-containing protein [Deltaproteobacteria bacterium]|nr:4Fe-4S dicluster domain-containing protein [Deltaproteobacteria bacterium]